MLVEGFLLICDGCGRTQFLIEAHSRTIFDRYDAMKAHGWIRGRDQQGSDVHCCPDCVGIFREHVIAGEFDVFPPFELPPEPAQEPAA